MTKRGNGAGFGAIVVGLPPIGRPVRAPRRAATGLVAELRRATAPMHDHVEGRLDLPGALRDVEHYAALLAAMRDTWGRLEEQIAASGAPRALGIAPPARAADLDEDLAALGVDPGPAPEPPAAAAPMGLAEGVGTLYVLEGSALGGVLLAPMIARHLGLPTGTGTRFFRGAGSSTGSEWNAMRRRVDRWGRSCRAAEIDRAVWAAQLTFAIVGGTMAGVLEQVS